MDSEDTNRLNADNFVLDLYRSKSFTKSFWGGIKAACAILAVVMSTYALYRSTGLRSLSSREVEDMSDLKFALLKRAMREDDQQQMIQRMNMTLNRAMAAVVLLRHALGDNDPAQMKNSSAVHRRLVGAAAIMFDCHLTSRQTNAVVIVYDGCHVDTTNGAMNKDTGIFTVKVSGIYQLSFTAKYVTSSKGRFGAWSDIYVNDTVIADSQREYNGNELSTSESSTHTILVLHPLGVGDIVKVQFNKDGNSYIHSDSDHDVHFTGVRLADLPRS